jgi:hypothetical protein
VFYTNKEFPPATTLPEESQEKTNSTIIPATSKLADFFTCIVKKKRLTVYNNTFSIPFSNTELEKRSEVLSLPSRASVQPAGLPWDGEKDRGERCVDKPVE